METELNVNTLMKVYCDDPTYRQTVEELAATLYHVTLRGSSILDENGVMIFETEDEVEEFEKMASSAEQIVNMQAITLSQMFGVPIDNVRRDIKECMEFLPKEDLQISYNAKQQDRLH